jgi:hypothetical protein
MKLRGKFNLMLLVVFGLALAASGYFSYKQLNDNARDEVLSNAGVLMETILSARTWAVNEVGPNLRETSEEEEMLMMGVPAYAANKVMEAVQKTLSGIRLSRSRAESDQRKAPSRRLGGTRHQHLPRRRHQDRGMGHTRNQQGAVPVPGAPDSDQAIRLPRLPHHAGKGPATNVQDLR